MNHKIIRHLVILAIFALGGLMTVQVVWFKQAYDLQQHQFTEKANSALFLTAQQLNKGKNQTPDVQQTSANTFLVQIDGCLNKDSLPVLLQKALANYGTVGDYEVTVNDCNNNFQLLNYNFQSFTNENKFLIEREQNEPCYYLNVTFNNKPKTLMQEMWFWLFASGSCLLVLIFFAYSLYALLNEKRLSEMKKDFISNMTHELKTPIANIAIASEMLKNIPLSMGIEKIKMYADIIEKENKRLEGQVERVLTMAFLEEKNMDLKKEILDVNKLLENIVNTFSPRIEQKNGSIVFEQNAKNAKIEADKFHLSNVIYSLLDNADKYSPQNPNIRLKTANTHSGICITISDNGIGMNKENQKKIFEKFYRVPTGNVHNVKGFGLGLTYVKMIIDAHGGDIFVDSQLDIGSNFSIYLQFS
jgi:two-component system phosphate regulon sensor histidine kinase PhoR